MTVVSAIKTLKLTVAKTTAPIVISSGVTCAIETLSIFTCSPILNYLISPVTSVGMLAYVPLTTNVDSVK